MTSFRPSQPTGPYPVRGVALEDGETPGIRQELREFMSNKKLWDLYLLGFWQFQQVPAEDQLSYFQIAGIHGLPYQGWPVDDPNLESIKKRNAGFCTHSSILFLTWHRPYLALFETILREAVLFVADQFTAEEGRDEYLQLAKAFRMPFWDWARPDLPVFPVEAADKMVQVIMPKEMRQNYPDLREVDGSVEIPNPLFAYKFPDAVDLRFKVHGLPTTTRYHSQGTSRDSSPETQLTNLIENITPWSREVNEELPVEGNLRERVVYLLKSYEIFDQVSHNQWDPARVPAVNSGDPEVVGLGFGSIEDIHNTVHGLVGGFGRDSRGRLRTGHMSSVPISAFDPMFWLHHTNIDRLVSIWEALHANPQNPDAWVTDKVATRSTWVTAAGADEGINTPLAPFYKDRDGFWTSNEVRNTRTFGYAYPETQPWAFADTGDYRQDIRQKLDSLYPSASLATMIALSRAGDQEPETTLKARANRLASIDAVKPPSTATTALSLAHANSPTGSELSKALPPVDVPTVEIPDGRSLVDLAKDDSYLEWLVNIKAVKHTLGGEYLVHVFLGRVPQEEPTVLYTVSPYHVGTFSPLGQPEDTACGKCQQDQEAGTEITGQVPLTIALAERYFAGELDSLGEEDVVKYLQINLHWEIVDKEGQRLQGRRDQVEGLLVGVVSNRVTLPRGGGGPAQYSPNIKIYPEVTTKQDGSSGRAEGTGVTEENKYFC